MSKHAVATSDKLEVQSANDEYASKPLNGFLALEHGHVLERRLYLSPIAEQWFVEFNSADAQVKVLPASQPKRSKPTHAVRLKTNATFFEGRFNDDIEAFLTKVEPRREAQDGGRGALDDIAGGNGNVAGHELGEADFSGWYSDPTSRGLGC